MRTIEIPEAPEFPAYSERTRPLVDAVIIKLYADTFIERFKGAFGQIESSDGYQYVGHRFNFDSEFSSFADLAIDSNNPLVITQFLRIIKEVDKFEIRQNIRDDFFYMRANANKTIESFLGSSAWVSYVNYCDAKGNIKIASDFENYFKQSKDMYYTYLGDLYDDEFTDLFKNGPKTSAANLRRPLETAINLGDSTKLFQLLTLHFRNEKMLKSSSANGDYAFRQNTEAIINKLHEINPNIVKGIKERSLRLLTNHTGNINRDSHLAIVTTYVDGDIENLFSLVAEYLNQGHNSDLQGLSEQYISYQLVLLAKLLNSPSVVVPEARKIEIENLIIMETKKLEPRYKKEVKLSFQHFRLANDLPEIIWSEFNEKYFNYGEVEIIFKHFSKYATDGQKEDLRSKFGEVVDCYLENYMDIDRGDEESRENQNYLSLYGQELKFISIYAREVGDLELLKNVVDIAYRYMEERRSGNVETTEAACIAIAFLIENGDAVYAYNLLMLAEKVYTQLEHIGLSKLVIYDKVDLNWVSNAIPLMFETLHVFSEVYPDVLLEETIDSSGDKLITDPQSLVEKIVDIYEWISGGLEVQDYIHKLEIEKDISFPLSLARDIFKKNISAEINHRLKTILIGDAKKFLDKREYTTASYYLSTAMYFLWEDTLDESEIIKLMNSHNLGWIVNLLLPEVKDANLPSFSSN